MGRGTTPLFSVIIAACNAERTIARAIASLAAQTRGGWEAIIVDDGSTDETAAIIEELARRDDRLRLIRQGNAGAAAARNAGLVLARGEWTLFLDADDTIHPRYFAKMHVRLRRHAGAGAVCCGYVRRDPAGGILARYPVPRLDHDPVGLCSARPPAALHAIMARTGLLRAVGGFDPGLRTNEDWDLWLRVARSGVRFAVERRGLADYWCSPGSLTRDGAAMLRDTLAMLARINCTVPPQAALEALLWNGGSAIGGGGDGRALVALLADPQPSMCLDRAAGALIEGLMLGAGEGVDGLVRGWPAIAPRLAGLLDAIGAAAGNRAAMTPLARRIEREIIRRARFAGQVRIGGTIGVMVRPGHFVRGVPGDPMAVRMVLKVPLLRPRSLWLVDRPAGQRVSGGGLAMLLLRRIAGVVAAVMSGGAVKTRPGSRRSVLHA